MAFRSARTFFRFSHQYKIKPLQKELTKIAAMPSIQPIYTQKEA